jgi:O-antigen biosynthesis protein
MAMDLGLLVHARATVDMLAANVHALQKGRGVQIERLATVTWFLPEVSHALRGGVRTIFALAEELSIEWGTLTTFVIYTRRADAADQCQALALSLAEHFPRLRFLVRAVSGPDGVSALPASQVGICTLWTTAYLLLAFNQTHRKFYFAQDFEPMFYAGGSTYLAIEQTYRFGFSFIANTPGVAQFCRRYSDDVVYFIPGVDRSQFFSGPRSARPFFQVVFYGRPGNARNCFELGLHVLRGLKATMGNDVRIVSVGADWDPVDHGVDGIIHNLGLLRTMESVAKVYRESDLGLVFMATPHPSYQPLEYMASGCVVATNINEANRWLLNEENSLLLEPLVDVAADRIAALLRDPSRMARKRFAADKTIAGCCWKNAFDIIKMRLVTAGSANSGRTTTEQRALS